MPDAALTIVAALASALGFVLLALAQERHWRAVCAAPALRRVHPGWFKAAGLALQGLALVLSLRAQGPSFGSLMWAMTLPAAAMAVAFTLAWRPAWLRPIAQRLRCRTAADR